MTEDTSKVHTRTITVTTREVDTATLIVEGELRDDRYCPSFVYTAQKFVEPGVIHHMVITFEVRLPGPVIQSATVVMKTVPHELCREAAAVIEKMAGLTIRPGFTQLTNELIGGTRGCIHLTNLVHATASAAVQGQWAFYLRQRADSIELPSFDSSLLVNSCWLWREDGPHLRRVRELEDEHRKKQLKSQ
ncbi:MAG: DUF2889 domain-containing protein [Deltaproteobacteria bacterium]|nr:DUF2889 domain-containing protein [Deltaproteobacteria bacterium]